METITTKTLVKNLLFESKAVKQSVGGTKEFRAICDYVNLRASYQDDEKCTIVHRGADELAEMVESEFSEEVIKEAKSVYCFVIK